MQYGSGTSRFAVCAKCSEIFAFGRDYAGSSGVANSAEQKFNPRLGVGAECGAQYAEKNVDAWNKQKPVGQ